MKVNLFRIGFFLFLISFQSTLVKLLACFYLILQIQKWTKIELGILFFLIFRLFISYSLDIEGNTFTGEVVQISDNSILIENQGYRWRIITNQSFILDDQIQVRGNVLQEDEMNSFFGKEYKKTNREKRIVSTVIPESIHLIKSSKSLRGRLHRKIIQKDEESESILLALLLNQKLSKSFEILSIFGVQYNFIYAFLKSCFGLFLYPSTSKKISLILFSFLTHAFHYPMAMIRRLIFELLTPYMSLYEVVGLYTILVYLFHPPLLGSLSFVFPIGLILIPKSFPQLRMFYSALLQSYFFYELNLIRLVGYSWFRKFIPVLILFSLSDTFLQTSFIQYFLAWMRFLSKYFSFFKWNGKVPFLFFLVSLVLIYTRINRRQMGFITLIFLLSQALGCFYPYAEVAFINVGQGDAILVRLPLNQANILIDTGKQSNWNNLDSYLKAKGITKIDTLILTHEDFDHNGNLNNIQNQYKVKQIIQDYRKEIEVSGLTIKFLSPLADYDNDNDNSLVTAFSINQVRFLLLGDVSEQVENDLIRKWGPIKFDVVKIAHHGSRYSTSTNFLRNFQFEYAIISAGSNDYGHPHKEVIDRLIAFDKTILNTKTSGDVVFVFTTFGNFIVSSAHEFDIINSVME